MASAAGTLVYWCHQCNVETQAVGEDALCSFCNQGFIEELHSTEVEPGVTFSTLPLAFGGLLRRPSPSSVGISRERSFTDSLSSPATSLPRQQPLQNAPSGPSQTDPQGHRPRILSGQLSGVPSLLEAMMQVIEDINGPFLPASHVASENLDLSEERGVQDPPGHDGRGSRGERDGSTHGVYTRAQTPGQNPEGDLSNFFIPPTLILHGDMPSGFRTLEVFIDHGQGMGPQMMPNHMRDYFFGPDLDRLIQMLAENDPNRYGTPPAAKSEVEKLPKFKITQEHVGSDIAQCAVCKDDFELDAEVQQMPCKHIYHPDCILPWLAEHNSCPICRFELPTDDAEYEARKGQGQHGGRDASTGGNVNVAERQGSGMSAGHNSPGSGMPRGGSDGVPDNGEESTRQFTLWGMPAIGFDMTRLSTLGLNAITHMEDRSNSSRQTESGESQGASREEGIRNGVPVQWLFRLFSSGNLSGQENGSSGDHSPSEQGSERQSTDQ